MRFLFVLFLIFSLAAQGQALRDINYNYLYNGTVPFSMSMKTVRANAKWFTSFDLTLTDTTQKINDYSIRFETRRSLFEKESIEQVTGYAIRSDTDPVRMASGRSLSGEITLPVSDQPVILVAMVTNAPLKRAWYYYTVLEPKYPETTRARENGQTLHRNFVKTDSEVQFEEGNDDLIVSYYSHTFPAAPVPFSEKLGAVSKGMRVDSTFMLRPGEQTSFGNVGLYLIQRDTNVAEGLAIRAEEDYPRYGKVESLADPLIYICTRQEYDRMKQAKGDKRAFDKIIISIARDADRAKRLMRNYFRRVELANTYFTSYKEGWKTDRGMIFIIFGPPTEVFRFNDREVWNYDNENFKISFDFAKAPSLFDPENYVLLRNKKYTQPWYEVIDLWRNARF